MVICSNDFEIEFSQGVILIIGVSPPENLALLKRATSTLVKKIFSKFSHPPKF